MNLLKLRSMAALAGSARAEGMRVSPDAIDRAVTAHERFVMGRVGGHRAYFRFLQAMGHDFSKRVLAEADFTGANLTDACLRRTVLERAILFCADLSGVDGRQANLRKADLRGTCLRGANLSGALLEGVDMRRAILAETDADGGLTLAGRAARTAAGAEAIAYTVDLSGALLTKAKFAEARLRFVKFDGAVLENADFAGAEVEGSSFRGAVLTGVDIGRLNATPEALEGAVMAPTREAENRAAEILERLEACEAWVASGGRRGAPAVLDEQDLRTVGQAFAGRQLTALSAKGACAVGVSFAGASLQGACFDRADLRDADFTGADLRGANFRAANLMHAKLDQANLGALALSAGSRPADFAEARMSAGALDKATGLRRAAN